MPDREAACMSDKESTRRYAVWDKQPLKEEDMILDGIRFMPE